MTSTTSHSAESASFPFEFAPTSTQDRDLLEQLNFLPGLKELLTIRQVHALEHGTVWVLSEWATLDGRGPDGDQLAGMSTAEGFYLYGRVNPDQLKRAVQTALHRLTQGEWDLAVHPRCGTNLSVGMLLTGGLALGINFCLPKGPVEQVVGLGVAATVATQLAPDVGSVAQRYLTTAIPFNLSVGEISLERDLWGRSAHFVRVDWLHSQ